MDMACKQTKAPLGEKGRFLSGYNRPQIRIGVAERFHPGLAGKRLQ